MIENDLDFVEKLQYEVERNFGMLKSRFWMKFNKIEIEFLI